MKKLTAVILAFVFVLGAPALPFGPHSLKLYANDTADQTAIEAAASEALAAEALKTQIVLRSPPERVGNMDLTIGGKIPQANILRRGTQAANLRPLDAPRNLALNNRFMSQYDDFIRAHRARASTFTFETNIYTSGRFVSVVMTMEAEGAGITRAAATTVIDAVTLNVITLTDFNPNALHIVNSHLQYHISLNPRAFVSNFTGIDNTHPFYLEDNVLRIPFGSGAWRVGDREIRPVPVPLAHVQDVIVDSSLFRVLPAEQYNTIMVRLSDVALMFGYAAQWDALTQTVDVRRNDVSVSTVVVGRNSYFYRGSEARELELAPEIVRNRVYVPLSFFREILGIATIVVAPGTADGHLFMSRFDTFSAFAFEPALPAEQIHGGTLLE